MTAATDAVQIMGLREGLYVTRNRRMVRLIGRYPQSWYGRFEDVGKSGLRDGKTYIWFLDGTCGSRRDGSWNIISKWTPAERG